MEGSSHRRSRWHSRSGRRPRCARISAPGRPAPGRRSVRREGVASPRANPLAFRGAAADVGRSARGPAPVPGLLREQSPSDGLSQLPCERVGHWEWSDGGGLQDHRRTLERIGDALGGGRCGDRGGVACSLRQRWHAVGRLLGAAAPQGKLNPTQVKDAHPYSVETNLGAEERRNPFPYGWLGFRKHRIFQRTGFFVRRTSMLAVGKSGSIAGTRPQEHMGCTD
jgi:hypothetical protein